MLFRNSVKRVRFSTSGISLMHDFSLPRVLSKEKMPHKKTKLVCTIGPSADKPAILDMMLKGGMNVARINFSHDNHEIQYEKLLRVREAIERVGMRGKIGIMLDTKGPEIRTGYLQHGKIHLKAGQALRVTPDYDVLCNEEIISLSYPSLMTTIKEGNVIFIADGSLTLRVDQINKEENCLETTVMMDYLLGERKNVNLPGVKIEMPVITEKDRHDIVDFGIKYDVDYIALSFTRSASCVQQCREVLGNKGQHIKIIPKIENEEGLENLQEILNSSDGIMMARGDLGMEIDPSKVLLAQKYMSGMALKAGKPVICATQMLESMCDHPRPTRAEMSDVGNAILDSVDSVMLSGETGNGNFIEEAVGTMTGICKELELAFDYPGYYRNTNLFTTRLSRFQTTLKGLASAAVKLSLSLESDAIIVLSNDPNLARHISNLRPGAFIVYPNSNESELRKLSLSYGVVPVFCEHAKNNDDLLLKARDFIVENKYVGNYRNVVVVKGDSNEVKIIQA